MTQFTEIKTKTGRIVFLKDKLRNDIRWATRGLIRVYDMQTADEKATESTHNLNGVGFTGADAEILSSFAKQVIAGRTLSKKQEAILFKKMPKYARQLEGYSKPKDEPKQVDMTEQMRDPNEEERRM